MATKIKDPFKAQFGVFQEIMKQIRYHADIFYIAENIIYVHSFLDFEEIIIEIHPDVDLSVYDRIFGYVGDIYDDIKDMKKTRLEVNIDNNRNIHLADPKIGKNTVLKYHDQSVQKSIIDEFYKHMGIMSTYKDKHWIVFPEDGINRIVHGKDYDLIIQEPEKIITLAKESLPNIQSSKLYYSGLPEFDNEDMFHVLIKQSNDIIDMYILIAAFSIPD